MGPPANSIYKFSVHGPIWYLHIFILISPHANSSYNYSVDWPTWYLHIFIFMGPAANIDSINILYMGPDGICMYSYSWAHLLIACINISTWAHVLSTYIYIDQLTC